MSYDPGRMKELYPLSGVIAIPQTPFDKRDGVDRDRIRRGVADRRAAGVDGLLYPFVASKASTLSPTERRAATQAVLEAAGGHVPVIVGASAALRRAALPVDAIHRRIAEELIEAAIVLHDEIGWDPA
jgi:dihydrodipicolinate synthase/N-acetylneuraminate lyase